jgi:microcystin-dependent protein
MTTPMIAEIRLFAGNFAPRGWALCHGQILSIAQNTALFSLLGTTYGGDGRTTFALPDLRGRVPVGQGQGPGLSPNSLGQQGGAETHTLTSSEMPAHNHPTQSNKATNDAATTSRPNGKVPAAGGAYADTSDGSALDPDLIGAAGGSQPHNNMQPHLALNYIIALQGIYPSRN